MIPVLESPEKIIEYTWDATENVSQTFSYSYCHSDVAIFCNISCMYFLLAFLLSLYCLNIHCKVAENIYCWTCEILAKSLNSVSQINASLCHTKMSCGKKSGQISIPICPTVTFVGDPFSRH